MFERLYSGSKIRILREKAERRFRTRPRSIIIININKQQIHIQRLKSSGLVRHFFIIVLKGFGILTKSFIGLTLWRLSLAFLRTLTWQSSLSSLIFMFTTRAFHSYNTWFSCLLHVVFIFTTRGFHFHYTCFSYLLRMFVFSKWNLLSYDSGVFSHYQYNHLSSA